MENKFKRHPLSALFPDISEIQFNQLKNDIEQNEQLVEGVMFEGMVLDGWNRYLVTGDKFKYRQFEGTYHQAVQYVMSMNLHRRHLTDNQRMCIAADLQQILKKKKTGNNQFTPKDKLIGNNGREGRTDIAVAKSLNVSPGSLARASFIKKHAPDKFNECRNGLSGLTVNKAYHLAKREMNGIHSEYVEDIKFPDTYSHFTEVEKFLKQISAHGWSCNILSKDGRFNAIFSKDNNPSFTIEHSITRAVVYALLGVRKQIMSDIEASKLKSLQSQAV